jgi:hypothetical protein
MNNVRHTLLSIDVRVMYKKQKSLSKYKDLESDKV